MGTSTVAIVPSQCNERYPHVRRDHKACYDLPANLWSILLAIVEKLRAMNLGFMLARSDSSLYFFDYDNHVFELDTVDLGNELSHGGR